MTNPAADTSVAELSYNIEVARTALERVEHLHEAVHAWMRDNPAEALGPDAWLRNAIHVWGIICVEVADDGSIEVSGGCYSSRSASNETYSYTVPAHAAAPMLAAVAEI